MLGKRSLHDVHGLVLVPLIIVSLQSVRMRESITIVHLQSMKEAGMAGMSESLENGTINSKGALNHRF